MGFRALRASHGPHYVLGYAALAIAALHIIMVIGSMQAANAKGLWFATFAFGGLAVQAFLGASLQSPGVYRAPLRRWHTLLFWTIAVLILGTSFSTSGRGMHRQSPKAPMS